MPDLRQVLKDFVATSNSGKYTTEEELLSKFPELKGYDIQTLKDFVATNNSGKYKTEEELFSKFPEFNSGGASAPKKKVSLESAAPQKPQAPTTELSSEDGLSATPVISKKKFSLTQEDLKGIGKKQPADMSGKPLLPEPEKAQKIFTRVYEEKQELATEKKKYADIFDKQVGDRPKPAESSYLKERLKSIDTDLINYEQDYIVPELEYQFGDLGFKFEESGIVGDYVKVTAPNNKTIEISADNLFSSKSKEQAEVLKKFIAENTPAKGLFVIENTMREQDVKFNSQKQVDESIKVISNEVNALNAKQKQFLIKKAAFDNQLIESGLTPELEQQRIALNEEMKSILQEEETIKQKSKRLDTAVGKYSISKAKQGTWVGAIANVFLEGYSSISAGITSLSTDIATEIAPAGAGMSQKDLKDVSIDIAKKIGVKGPSESQTVEQWKSTLSEDQLDEWEDQVDDYIKKDIKSRTLPLIRIGNREIFGDSNTTKQFSDLKEKGFWGGAILGVAKSLPAMIGGAGPAGWAQRTAQMYAQISDGLAVEMENNPEFANITENEKLAITLPIGITSAVLEAYGLRNVIASRGVINSITMSALGRAGANTSAKTFRELVESEIESKLARGLITISAAGVAEFETGAAQELTETGYKIIYDKLKEKDMFNTPDSKLDLVENILVAGAQEAVGGFVLGVPTGVSAAYSKKGFLKMDDASFEMFANMANDDKMQSAYITSLKEKITQGAITEKEAKEELNNYRRAVGLYRQLPEGLTTQQKKEAMNLLKEKRDLENYVDGKDNALVVKQKNRITEINDSLTKLSETDAIQEQSTTEIPVQSETGISETVEERTPEAEPQVVTEQVTQEEVTEPLKNVDSTTEALRDLDEKTFDDFSDKFMPDYKYVSDISEAYHKAKEDGSNPELVQAVETLLAPEVKTETPIGIPDEVSQPIELAVTPEVVTEQVSEEEVADAKQKIEDERESELGKVEYPYYRERNDKENDRKVKDLLMKMWGVESLTQEVVNRGPIVDRDTYNKLDSELQDLHKKIKAELTDKINAKYDEQLKALEKPKETIPDEVSQPIELAVTPETAPAETTAEQPPVAETPVEKIKGGSMTNQNFLLNDKQLTYQESFDLANSELKELESQERTLAVQREIEGKVKEINNIKEQAEKRAEEAKDRFKDFSKEEFIEALNSLNGKVIVRENQIGFKPKGGNSYYWFNENYKGGWGKVEYTWSDAAGRRKPGMKAFKLEMKIRDTRESVKAKAEVAPAETTTETAPTEELNDLLDVDTKDENGLKRVYDFLDGLDTALDLGPNELNDVTRVMAIATAKAVVKTLKALINAGITLQEAIERAAEAFDIKSEQIIDALDIVSKINENKSEGISEMELPGYNKLSKVIDSAIKAGKTIDNILSYIERSEVYKNATDVQKELLIREVRKKFGLREKSAPSVGKLFGKIKDIKKITMTEKDALVKQLKDTAKGARQSIQEWKKQTQSLAKDLAELKKSGKITVSQETAILNKFAKVNIFSEKSVSRFTDYMTKVFADADYKAKLSTARKTLASLKKLSKNTDKNADLRVVTSEFSKIDPSIVEDIDEYNVIAKKIKEAIQGSKTRKSTTNFAETVNIEDTTAYTEKTLAEQEIKLREEKIKELQDLLGVDASTFSAEEIDTLFDIYGEEESSPAIKDNEKIIRAAVKKAFDIYSTVIKEILSTGVDPFTGENVVFSEKEKELIERFMRINPNKIVDPKEALRAVDSLINFIQNKSTAGMLKSIADSEAISSGNTAVKEGFKASRLRKYWIPKLGRALGQKTTTLPVLFEKMFKGVTKALGIEELIGTSDLINNSSKAESESNQLVKEYVKEFYKRKANGESYNSAYNDVERGVLAHMMRNVIGTEARMKKVFDKRKQEVLDTINLLASNGNESEIELAKLIKKAYDKVLSDSENIKDVRSRSDTNNVQGVEYWVSQWDKRYEALSDLAVNFYNKVLGRDLGYTPDRIVKLQDKREDTDLQDIASQFFANTDEILYNKKSGSLMDKQEDRKIPKDMYVDFSFDKKNANAMNDALTDLYTAFDIRKVGAFLKSDNFRKIFPNSKDANLVDKRIKKFVRLTRKKSPYSGSEISDLLKKADRVAKLGVTMSLASIKQPFIQTIPVMLSTAINAGSIGIGSAFDPKYNKWLNSLGYAISNRGVESQAQLESMNNLLEKAAEMPLDKALKFVEKVQDQSLKLLLVKGDVAVARASFKAYYEQSLKQQGLQSSNIDYSNHEVNKKAANYAQRMVDRQQNISNHALSGDLFTSESDASKIFLKMLMPFSSFRMNQSARLGSDLGTLEYWNTSSKQDKIVALRSIAGYAAESATYRGLQIGAAMLFSSIASYIMGTSDEEEEEKNKKNVIKGAAQGAFVDTFSPLPLTDPFTQDALAYSVDEIESLMDIPEEERVKLFSSKDQSALKIFGTYGIPLEKAKDIYMLGRLAYGRKFKDSYGNEKEISQKDADNLKKLIGPLIVTTSLGIASPDVSAIVRKSKKIAEKGSESTKESITTIEDEADTEKELSADQEVEKAIKEMEDELK